MQIKSSRSVKRVAHGDRLRPLYGVVEDPVLKKLWVLLAMVPTVADGTDAYEGVAALSEGYPMVKVTS